jgi:predicted DNA-binding transcriptional regulator YafY
MARNSELVRQWEILRAIDGARNGIPVGKLASERGVCERTIRRDIDALQRSGFSLYDEKVNGTSMWKLRGRPFGRLAETGLGVTELCALYLSHALLATLTGTPLLGEAERAFAKIERALPMASRRFLDQLPRVLKAKAAGRKKQDPRRADGVLERVLDATLRHRRAEMRYAKPALQGRLKPAPTSAVKTYILEPQRIAYAHGGMYLIAWVPAYGELRTFATERIETFALLDEQFEPKPLPLEPFEHSLGVNTGTPEKIVVEFSASAAPFVREREWHPSQRMDVASSGGIVLTLNVCNDYALRAWILGFGADARVVAPAALAKEIAEAARQTWRNYPQFAARLKMLKVG